MFPGAVCKGYLMLVPWWLSFMDVPTHPLAEDELNAYDSVWCLVYFPAVDSFPDFVQSQNIHTRFFCNRVNTKQWECRTLEKWVPCGDKRIMSIHANHSLPKCSTHRLTKSLNRTRLGFQSHFKPTHIMHDILEMAVCCGAPQRCA